MMLHLAEAAPRPPGTEAIPVSTLALYGVALLVLVVAALTTTRPFIRVLRTPVVGALVGAGWLWLAFGAAIGPYGLDLLNTSMIDSLRPLFLIAIGWVGLTVGLQVTAPLLKAVPGRVWMWVAAELVLCGLVAALIVVGIAPRWMAVDHAEGAWIAMPVAIVAASLAGWNPETRSMLVRPGDDERAMARMATGAAGLCGVAAVLALGLVSQVVVRDAAGTPIVSPPLGLAGLAAAAGLAVCAALALHLLLRRGDWSTSRTLVVVMSVSALAAGIATELAFSPLLATLLCGAAIANLPGRLKLSLWRLLSRSERAVATILFILAGALLVAPGADWRWVLVLAGACVVTRVVLKPLLMRAVGVAREAREPNRRVLHALPARQSALAVIVAVAALMSEDSQIRRELLMAIALAGAASAAWPLHVRMRAAREAVRA
jgi:hypothetical protein